MKLVFYSLYLNHHQVRVADEIYKILGKEYKFVELGKAFDTKGSIEDFSNRSYLIKAWSSKEEYDYAMSLALSAEVCVFAGNESLPFERARLRLNKLSFDMGERMLKRGWLNVFSPRVIYKMFLHYALSWNRKPLYKLCCSAFAKEDLYKLHTYKNKCYKWGYFTKVDENFEVEAQKLGASTSEITPLMWCSRFLKWKHPELPVFLASKLKNCGYSFSLDMYGSGEELENTKKLAQSLNVTDVVNFCGNLPNNEILDAMRGHSIFLFTSDKNEGWGAVLNEAMSSGCVPVASSEIGSAPYLIKDRINGFKFKSSRTLHSFRNPDELAIESLCEKVEWLLNHPKECAQMQVESYKSISEIWSPANAAKSLILLIDNLQNGKDSTMAEGPGSKA